MGFLSVGGLNIPVAPGSGSWDWNDAVDRRRAFDNTYRASATGGAARDGHWTTPPVTRDNASIYRAQLSKVDSQLCVGDLLESPTMCCAEFISETPVKQSNGHLLQLSFALHEVQGKRLLLKYTPGDTITGESFTRSTTAPYIANSGILPAQSINIKRDDHWPGAVGPRSLLLEGARTNSVSQPSDVTNAAWGKVNCTALKNAVGPDGVSNSASTITATASNANASIGGAAMGAASTQTVSGFVKAGSPSSGWVWVGEGSDTIWHRFWINLATGAIGFQEGLTRATVLGIAGGWYYWTMTWTTTNASTAALYAGMATASNNFTNAVGDKLQIAIYDHELNAPFASSPMPGARGADSYSLPFTSPPAEMTVYVKFVEMGNVLTSAGTIFQISNSTPADPRLEVYGQGGVYHVFHSNGAASVAAALAASPALGATVEIVARLYGDGSVDLSQSINGAAATSSAQSGANALATAWSGQLCWLNSAGAIETGFTAIQSFKIVAGSRSLSDMRAA